MQVKHIEKILWESLELTPSFLPYLWILKQEFIKKILRVSFYWLSSNLWGCDGYCCMSIWLNSKIFPADKEIFYGTSPRCCSYNDVNCLKECIVSLLRPDNADQQVGLCHSSIRTWRYFTSDLLWNIFLCNKEKKSFF